MNQSKVVEKEREFFAAVAGSHIQRPAGEEIRWNDADINARATVKGTIQRKTLHADRIAP